MILVRTGTHTDLFYWYFSRGHRPRGKSKGQFRRVSEGTRCADCYLERSLPAIGMNKRDLLTGVGDPFVAHFQRGKPVVANLLFPL